MITILTVKFRGRSARDYTSQRVNKLARMMEKHVTVPHEFVCLTDDASGLDVRHIKIDRIRAPIWRMDNFTKLRAFEQVFDGDCVLLDMDAVILRNIDHIVADPAPFKIMAGTVSKADDLPVCPYNSSLVKFDQEHARRIWDAWRETDIADIPTRDSSGRKMIGSDQVFLAHAVPDAPTWTPSDGVIQWQRRRGCQNPAIVFFAGLVKPWDTRVRRETLEWWAAYDRA